MVEKVIKNWTKKKIHEFYFKYSLEVRANELRLFISPAKTGKGQECSKYRNWMPLFTEHHF